MNINIHRDEGAFLFGDFTYGYSLVTVRDGRGCEIQVDVDELIPYEPTLKVNKKKYIKVYYDGQPYWLPIEYYFPL